MTRALVITNPFAARADARAVTAILKILERGGGAGAAHGARTRDRSGRRAAVGWGALLRRRCRDGVRRGTDGRHRSRAEAALEVCRIYRARRDDTSLSAQRTAPRDRGWHSPGNPRRHAAGVELWPAAAGLSQAARRSLTG